MPELMTLAGGTPSDSPVDLGDLPSSIGFALRRAQLLVFNDFLAALASEDIRATQFAVLTVMNANPGLRQTQVCAALGIQTTNFVALFDGLEQRGLAERRPVETDRRAKGLFLTDAGQIALTRLTQLQAAHEARFTERIGADGKQLLLSLLQRLTDPAPA